MALSQVEVHVHAEKFWNIAQACNLDSKPLYPRLCWQRIRH